MTRSIADIGHLFRFGAHVERSASRSLSSQRKNAVRSVFRDLPRFARRQSHLPASRYGIFPAGGEPEERRPLYSALNRTSACGPSFQWFFALRENQAIRVCRVTEFPSILQGFGSFRARRHAAGFGEGFISAGFEVVRARRLLLVVHDQP
jgi:hypothetical protein